MKVKTADLEGAALDWAVAGLVHSEKWRHDKYEGGLWASMHGYNPSTEWNQGGPLIEKYSIELGPGDAYQSHGGGIWNATIFGAGNDDSVIIWGYGETILLAAMRAIVAAELGQEVDIPDELIPIPE